MRKPHTWWQHCHARNQWDERNAPALSAARGSGPARPCPDGLRIAAVALEHGQRSLQKWCSHALCSCHQRLQRRGAS